MVHSSVEMKVKVGDPHQRHAPALANLEADLE
jgi:hypothetical protein